MNEAAITILTYIGVYTLVLIFIYLLMNFLTNGFLTIYLRVKMLGKRKNRVLVMIKGRIQNYFVVGRVQGGDLLYIDNEAKAHGKKTEKRVKIPKDSIFRMLNVYAFYVDEGTNSILTTNLKGVSGFDAIRINDLLKRALHSAKVGLDTKPLSWVFVLALLAVVGIIIIYFKIGSIEMALQVTSTITGGNIPA